MIGFNPVAAQFLGHIQGPVGSPKGARVAHLIRAKHGYSDADGSGLIVQIREAHSGNRRADALGQNHRLGQIGVR